MDTVKKIADEADMIIDGYSYKINKDIVQCININTMDGVLILSLENGQILESSMPEIEEGIAQKYFIKNKKFIREDFWED